MILHDPVVVPTHLAAEFEKVCDICFVTKFKYEDQNDGVSRYSITATNQHQVESVFLFIKGLSEYQREYDHYNHEIKAYVRQYQIEKWKTYSKLVLAYLILLLCL